MKILLSILAVVSAFHSLTAGGLEPLMTIPDEAVVESDFSEPNEKPDKKIWQPRQATRWEVADGVLRGIESSAENQAKKSHHRGLEPRLSVPPTPTEFAAGFAVRFSGGEETAIVPFVEFGHHIVRLKFSETEGLALLADYESLKVAEAPDYKYQPGEWIRILAELKGEAFVVQIEGGPTLYAKHPVFSKPAPSGGNGLGVAGPRGGMVELDDVKISSVKEGNAEGWSGKMKEFPVFDSVVVREKPKK